MKRDPSHPLRQGFTTGSAAAAAAKAATMTLLGAAPWALAMPPVSAVNLAAGQGTMESGGILAEASGVEFSCIRSDGAADAVAFGGGAQRQQVDIPLPGGGRLVVPLASVSVDGWAWVIKDAGDDPDATHRARIGCRVELLPDGPLGVVHVDGGSGVGRVTLPGLPVPPGQAAINPAPRQQIADAVREALDAGAFPGAARVTVVVENGEAIARHTLNPRLGILGGISILGTAGIVKPFSHEAWKATIISGLSVARAAGVTACAFSTGRRSERLLMAHCPNMPPLAFVQAADFFAFALKNAVGLGFSEIVWGCYFGKLAKMAQGLEYTHAHAGETDFTLLANLAAQAGAERAITQAVAAANTARHALELVGPESIHRGFVELTAQRALAAARSFAGPGPRLRIVCFGFEEGVLTEAKG